LLHFHLKAEDCGFKLSKGKKRRGQKPKKGLPASKTAGLEEELTIGKGGQCSLL
jgi:hypothetical protein